MQAVRLLHRDNTCSQVILSDANSVYIEEILAHHGLQVSIHIACSFGHTSCCVNAATIKPCLVSFGT